MYGLIIFFVIYILGGVFTFNMCADEICDDPNYITIGETLYLLLFSLFSFIPGICVWLIEHANDPIIKRNNKNTPGN
jgi:hypothetical protein